MRTVLEGWEVRELRRAAERSRAKGDGGRRFVAIAERTLDPDFVRALEQRSGVAIAEHLAQVFRAFERGEPVTDALAARTSALGMPLQLAREERIDEHDELDEDFDDATGEHPHVARLRSRGTVLLTLGVLALAFALVMLVLSVALALASVEGRFSGLVCFCATTSPAGLLGGAATLMGIARRRRAHRVRDLEALALSHARIPLATIDAELGTSGSDTRALIREALGHGILEGRLDLEEGVFLSAIADTRVGQRTIRCRTCGASSAVVRGPGIRPRCSYCGTAA